MTVARQYFRGIRGKRRGLLVLGRFAFILLLLARGEALAADPVDGRFELVDHNGQTVNESSYDGRLRLVFFGFTRCPVICPTTMYEIARAMKALGDRSSAVQPLFITIDPDNDSVDVVASYVRHFHPGVVGLTGTPQQIAAAARSFSVTYGGTADGEASGIFHSSYVYVMDRQGRFLDLLGYGAKPDAIVEMLEQYL